MTSKTGIEGHTHTDNHRQSQTYESGPALITSTRNPNLESLERIDFLYKQVGWGEKQNAKDVLILSSKMYIYIIIYNIIIYNYIYDYIYTLYCIYNINTYIYILYSVLYIYIQYICIQYIYNIYIQYIYIQYIYTICIYMYIYIIQYI